MSETIFALASGPPPSGIAVVRVSGPQALAFANSHINGPPLTPRLANLRTLKDAQGEIVDEGLVVFMPGPESYTGEDVLELNLHGGRAVVEHALEVLGRFEGMRLAEPGEFTRRAFEAGKLDLTQAEGIADLIEAETRAQKLQALAQTDGALSALYNGWREDLLAALALLEVSVDFPDEGDAPEQIDGPVRKTLTGLVASFDDALERGSLNQSVRDGFKVAILGAPNVGKSTLLNQFAGRDAAIVTDIPGTTRDVVEVRCRLGAHIVWFADTAGLRETEDVVEAEGIRRAWQSAEDADIRLFVTDGTPPLLPFPSPKDGDIEIRNKADLGINDVLTSNSMVISARNGDGIDNLLREIERVLDGRIGDLAAPVITRLRHRQGIEVARDLCVSALRSLEHEIGTELVSEDVRLAARGLAALVGEIDVEEILGAVFSEFCIGK